ncbi:MAG TPA: M28 family peptidase [Cyclobacteriaceae bacterium]|nr:M28 family peptidase [Cyclobacteriaceae bacterium]
MKRQLFAPLLILLPVLSLAQDPESYASLISPKALKENLSIIASDAMEGRFTGSRGQKMAAAFIADHFERVGLKPINNGSYYQPFSLYSYKPEEVSIKTKSASFATPNDVVFYGTSGIDGEKEYEVVLVGSGSDEELSQVVVKDKVALLVLPDLTMGKIGSLIGKITMRDKAAAVILYSTVAEPEYKAFMNEVQSTLSEGAMTLERANQNQVKFYIVSKAVVESLYGSVEKLKPAIVDHKKNALKKIKPVKAIFKARITEEIVKTENVMGFMEGSDKKDEVVVITAHYDHVGLTHGEADAVYNGADDDGSGTVTVLQLATAFAKAKKDGHGPRRSILFMTVSAEELGLFGSEFYTDTQPVIPLEKTVVDLNIDMIGRWDAEHAGKPAYVYVIGADKLSSELQEINVRNNEKYTKLEFDYTYNDVNHPTNLYQRSDHWNFAKHGIPIIFFFDGIHEDYHKASDEVGKIDFDLLATRGKVVFYTAWEVANREQRLKVDK